MQLKDYLFYSILAPASAVGMYTVYQLHGISKQLKNDHPECTKSNPHALELFIGTWITLFCMMWPVTTIAYSMFMRALPVDKYQIGSKVRAERADFTSHKVFSLFIYIGSSLALFFVLKRSTFLDTRLWGDNPKPQYLTNYPCTVIPNYLEDIFIVKLAYHSYDLVATVLFHRNRKDFSEFILHHVVTVCLILFAYYSNLIPIGSVIMLIHDVPDVFVALLKSTVDISSHGTAYTTWFLMAGSWFYFRLYLLPFYVIYPYYLECISGGHKQYAI